MNSQHLFDSCWISAEGYFKVCITFLTLIRALASARGSVANRMVAEGPKGPRTKGTATRGPEGPESGQNMRVRGPEGPEDEQSPVPVLALASASICFSRFSQKSRFSWHYLGPLMTAKMHENFSRVLYLQYKHRVKKSKQFVDQVKSYARSKFRKNAAFVSNILVTISRPESLSLTLSREDTILLKVIHVWQSIT